MQCRVVFVAVDDVVADRAGEEKRLLEDEADLARALVRRNDRMSRPSSSTRPAVGIVEPRHQRRRGGLAAAGRADQRVGLPRSSANVMSRSTSLPPG